MPRPAFTLLESLVALTVLALVAGACLELRAGAVAHTSRLAGRQEDQRRARAVFDLALAGHLGAPTRTSDEDPDAPVVWTGEYDGARYRLLRETVVVPNPLYVGHKEDERSAYPERTALYRYTLELDEAVHTMEWTR
jgi:prepilin-type N-terminal cleavage/methylation domain-containing protein